MKSLLEDRQNALAKILAHKQKQNVVSQSDLPSIAYSRLYEFFHRIPVEKRALQILRQLTAPFDRYQLFVPECTHGYPFSFGKRRHG